MLAPRRFSRFRIVLFAAFERVAVLLGGRHFYRWRFLNRARIVVREETVVIEGLARELDGFTIAHLSDVHAGPFLGHRDLEDVVRIVEQREPDVVAWTGDYVVHGIQHADPILPELKRCVGRRATFAVFGNHDYLHREESRFVAALEPAGWSFLRNGSQILEVGCARIGFAGIEDPEEGKVVDADAATRGLESIDVVVALAHGPRAAPSLAQRGVRVVLSGHTHATQVDAPFLRDLGPAHPGLRVELGATTLVVTRGVGAIGVPVRFRVPAEVVLVTLRPEPERPADDHAERAQRPH